MRHVPRLQRGSLMHPLPEAGSTISVDVDDGQNLAIASRSRVQSKRTDHKPKHVGAKQITLLVLAFHPGPCLFLDPCHALLPSALPWLLQIVVLSCRQQAQGR